MAASDSIDIGSRLELLVDESIIQRAAKQTVARAGLTKRATCHTFRHSFPTHLLESGSEWTSAS